VKYEALVRKAQDLKRRSRQLRDKGDLDGAEGLLRNAIALLREPGEEIFNQAQADMSASQDYRDLAKELADCLGSLGGVLRRQAEQLDQGSESDEVQARLKDALAQYEKGLKFEQDDRFRVANSYNLVQSVVLPVISEPHRLDDEKFKPKLHDVHAAIERQIATVRAEDPWAYSDRGLVELLLGDTMAANESWDQMDALQPERNVYTSGLPVLQSLSNKLMQVDAIQHAVNRFRASIEALGG
jgi:tetratricopeptide (TPR) repeat protein